MKLKSWCIIFYIDGIKYSLANKLDCFYITMPNQTIFKDLKNLSTILFLNFLSNSFPFNLTFL